MRTHHIMVIIIIRITFMTYKYGKYISYTLWYTYKDRRVLQDAYIILCITRTSSCIAGDVGRTTIITICPFTRGRRLKRYTISAARRIGTYNTGYRYIIRMRHKNNNHNLNASAVRLSEIGKIATKAVRVRNQRRVIINHQNDNIYYTMLSVLWACIPFD